MDSEYLSHAADFRYAVKKICLHLVSHHLLRQNRNKVANTSILVIAMKIKSDNPTYMLIKFFLIWNHEMNVVAVTFMLLFC